MELNQRQIDIIDILLAKNRELAKGDDTQRRQLTQMIAEQYCLEFGNRWGMKARPGGSINSASKDSIAYYEDDHTISIWDWQNGTSRERQVKVGQGPTYPHSPQSDALFILVNAKDNIGQVPPDNGDNNPPSNDEGDILDSLSQLETKFDEFISIVESSFREIEAHFMELQQKVNEIQRQVEEFEFPIYDASILGRKVTLTPRKKE